MKNKFRYILAFVVLALLAAVLVWKYTFKKSDTSVVKQKPDVEISALALLQEFEADETTANTKYLDKVILVSGTIDSVTEDSLEISVFLRENDTAAGVICIFDKTSADISRFTKGQPIQIKGVCNGYLLDVVLNRCALE